MTVDAAPRVDANRKVAAFMLRCARNRAGMSQRQVVAALPDHARVLQQGYSLTEKGYRTLRPAVIRALVNMFDGVTVDDLAAITSPEKPPVVHGDGSPPHSPSRRCDDTCRPSIKAYQNQKQKACRGRHRVDANTGSTPGL